MSMNKAVAGEVECIDLYLGFLPRMDEANVFIRYHRLDFKTAICRHDGHQYLRRCNHSPFSMHRELLHGAVHGGGERLKAVFLRSLKQLFMEARGFLLSFGQILEVAVL